VNETGCFCGRCVPNDIPKDPWRTACARCGEEVRFGVRDGVKTWHHREDVGHTAILGHSPLTRPEPTEVYGTDEEPEIPRVIEVHKHPVDPADFAPTSGIRQIANLVSGVTRVMPNGKTSTSQKHPPAAPGWELISLTHARGPYMGSKGEVLSISDTHLLKARGPVALDGTRRVAVASWRDGKFDFAYIGTIKDSNLSPVRVSSDELKGWVKGSYEPPPPDYSTY
jgi:hypothetical protein